MRIGVIALARETFDVDAATTVAHDALAQLAATPGVDVVAGDAAMVFDGDGTAAIDVLAAARPDVVVVLQATFTSTSVIDALVRRVDAPIVMWAFPEPPGDSTRLRLNSLCGITLAIHHLRNDGWDVRWVHGRPGERATTASLAAALEGTSQPVDVVRAARPAASPEVDATAARIADSVARARIGRVGAPPEGFGAREDADAPLIAHLGVTVDARSVDDLFVEANAVSPHAVEAARRRTGRTTEGLQALSDESVDHGLRLELALRSLVQRHDWSGVATRCLPECATEYGSTICTALGMMAERGVPAGCEADVLGTVTNLALAQLSDRPPYLADLVEIDIEADTGTFWHCGVAAPSLARPDEPVVVSVHPNRRIGMANDFELAPGRVTIARITERPGGALAMVIGSGVIVDQPHRLRGTTAVVRFDRTGDAALATLLDGGLDHHLSLAYGDHRAVLEALAHQWGLGVIDL